MDPDGQYGKVTDKSGKIARILLKNNNRSRNIGYDGQAYASLLVDNRNKRESISSGRKTEWHMLHFINFLKITIWIQIKLLQLH